MTIGLSWPLISLKKENKPLKLTRPKSPDKPKTKTVNIQTKKMIQTQKKKMVIFMASQTHFYNNNHLYSVFQTKKKTIARPDSENLTRAYSNQSRRYLKISNVSKKQTRMTPKENSLSISRR